MEVSEDIINWTKASYYPTPADKDGYPVGKEGLCWMNMGWPNHQKPALPDPEL